MLLYILKLNLTLALLCLLFQVLMYRDTYFGVRRLLLWGIYLTAFALPLWTPAAGGAATMHLATDYAAYVLPTLDVTAMRLSSFGFEPSGLGCAMWYAGMTALWAIIYLIPVVWMTARLIMQIAYIIYLRCTCPLITDLPLPFGKETAVRLFPRPCSPFSFGPWIFLHAEGMDEQTLRQVLIHEQTHVRQWHTVDILFAEITSILFWWNPAVWLMRREVRMNLEFLADKAVADDLGRQPDEEPSGLVAGLRAYQYRLLGFTTQTNVATLANNFNVLPLKRRIAMMNSRRTRPLGMVKYLLFVPAAAALLLLSNVDALARSITVQTSTTALDDKIHDIVEELPEYPGGTEALFTYLMRNITYPKVAHEWGVQGKVIVSFVVEKDGTLSDIKAQDVRDLNTGKPLPEVTVAAYAADKDSDGEEQARQRAAHEAEGVKALKAEAVRVVTSLPEKWKPGRQEGQPARVHFSLPITFRLQ